MLIFLGYMAPFALFVGLGLTTYFLYRPEKAQGMAIQLAWTLGGYYIQVHDYFLPKTPVREESTDGKEDVIHSTSQTLLYYIADDGSTCCTDVLTEEAMEQVALSKPTIMFLKTKYKDSEYFVRTKNPLQRDTEHSTMAERPFIQVEFMEKDQPVVDVHTKLAPFYVSGNRILDKVFLQWYLSYYYNIHVFGEYTLKVFDKDVNMFVLNENQHIMLEEDGYQVVDNDIDEASEKTTQK